jgi:hypothetical protein
MQWPREMIKLTIWWCALFSLGMVMLLGSAGPVAAVGPYFENERGPGDQIRGPAPESLIPGPPLTAPRHALEVKPSDVTRLVKGTILTADEYIYVVRDESASVEVAIKITPDTRITAQPRVGDKIEAQVRSNGDAWSVKPIP